MNSYNRVTTALKSARAGGQKALTEFRTELKVETKTNKNDPVSNADRIAQKAIVDQIKSEYPKETVVAEENDQQKTVPLTDVAWVVDPIDGTANFIRGLPVWTTTVAVVKNREPIAGVTVMPAMCNNYVATQKFALRNNKQMTVADQDDTEQFILGVLGSASAEERSGYASVARTGIKEFGDIRRFGCTTAAFAFVASGELDAVVTATQKKPWDIIAGAHIIESAGGTVTNLDGKPWDVDESILVGSNGKAHETVLEKAQKAFN